MPQNERSELEFVPLHFGDKLHVVNPRARLGVLTLWSKIPYVLEKMGELGIDLDPHTSKIAAIGTLYGNGIPHLLRNLLYNPQITGLIVCGADRSGSAGELQAFFEKGLEETTVLGETVSMVCGTNRVIDDRVTPDMFSVKPVIVSVGDLKSDESRGKLREAIDSWQPGSYLNPDRTVVELPRPELVCFPGDPRNQNISKDSPLDAWRELVFRIYRFGHMTKLRKGDRQELQNVRVVIREPRPDTAERLREYGFDLHSLEAYQKDMLESELPPDQSYTYGNRIRSYYGFDALAKFAVRLKSNPQDRDCYLSLWNSFKDIDADDSPCLVSLFFRTYDGRLTLTAVYRTHNAVDAWLKNAYGLMKCLEEVSRDSGIPMGELTMISHSISIDPSRFDVAERVAKSRGFEIDFDPNGQFAVSLEEGEIVARHLDDSGRVLGEYRSKKAERIQHEIARDCAISDVNHAMYLGRQLARAQVCLETGEEFEES